MPKMRKPWVAVIVLLSLLGLACAQQPTTYMVPMRDGVKLATDVYLPAGNGPWPVILSRTPYGKPGSVGKGKAEAPETQFGYVRVWQDMRGRFQSEGTSTVFMTDGCGELQDAYDTCEWILKQPWCDGKIGMVGGSAGGIVQYLAAGAQAPGLKFCHVTVACSSLYHMAAYQGGVLHKHLIETWLASNKFPSQAYEMLLAHPTYDGLWQTMNIEERPEKITVPMLHRGGWYDCFAQGTLNAFDVLQHKGGEGARGNQYLVFGPWVHGCRPEGELEFPANALREPVQRSAREWFDYFLKGVKNSIPETPHVQYYVMGDCSDPKAPGNEWRSTDDWPVPANSMRYYIHKDGSLSTTVPTEENASMAYDFDPKSPVPTVGGANLTLTKGPYDQRKVESRPDVLLFQTPPLAEPLEVTGRVTAVLWVSSSAPDTDFTAKLTDVYPDGRSMLLCDGIIRTRYRDSFSKPELMQPGQVYQVSIDLWSTSIIFNKGHRIRLAISSSNYPRFEVNPNTGAAGVKPENPQVAHNTVYMDARRPSHVILAIP